MAERSGVAIRMRMADVPLLPGARTHAESGVSFGGLERNQAFYLSDGRVRIDVDDDALRSLALDPQTSGGLLVGVPAAHEADWVKAMAAHGVNASRIGSAIEGAGVVVTA
jgi:selenide,water dikinase